MLRLRSSLAAAGVAVLAAAPAAHATFPGRNGNLVVALDTCEFNPHLRAYTPGGRSLGPLTRPCETLGAGEDEEPIVRAAHSPDWSPDGRRLVFRQRGPEPDGLYVAAADGTGAQPIPGTGGGYEPSFAPDGRRIAYMEDGAVWTVAVDGSERRRLRARASCPPSRSNCTFLGQPRWSPDGRRIAVVVEQFAYGPGRPPSPLPGIWLLDAGSGKLVRRVVRSDGIRTQSDVDWSPDGRRLAYRTSFQQDELRGGASGGNVYAVRADGRGRRLLVHRERYAETVPRWSPDGRWIAWIGLSFTAGDVAFDVTPTVYRRRVAGGRPQLVRRLPRPYVEEADYFAPQLAWQPLPAPR
jgi:Tol biopolymer transport system component